MTLKRDKLAKELLTSKTMREASIKAGYAPKSNKPYAKGIKRYIASKLQELGVTKESLTEAYQHLLTECQKKGDLATAKATLDSLGKMYGQLRDTTSTQVSVFTGDMIKDLPPIDVSTQDNISKEPLT
jgi:phage terminase small subunit